MKDNTKKKRYYKVGERVFVKPLKQFGVIRELRINPEENLYKVVVQTVELTTMQAQAQARNLHEYDLWEIDKDKTLSNRNMNRNTVYFSKIISHATIPSKRKEDAGYDVYAVLEDGEPIRLKKGKPTLVPTGIACALPIQYCFNLKHERGSTGKIGMSILSGLVDSGYRGEIFVNVVATEKDIVLTREVTEVTHRGKEILYPVSKAICQGTIDIVPQVRIEEIPYGELEHIPSERGKSALGQSGK